MNPIYESSLQDCSSFLETFQDSLTENHLDEFQLVLMEHESIDSQIVAMG